MKNSSNNNVIKESKISYETAKLKIYQLELLEITKTEMKHIIFRIKILIQLCNGVPKSCELSFQENILLLYQMQLATDRCKYHFPYFITS